MADSRAELMDTVLTDRFDRALLSHLPTPLEFLPNLSKVLEGPDIWIKRDDCTGLALGGNKARQLEFHLGHALAQGADTILTSGATQSNHVRMTVAAARKLGLQVEVQLEHLVEGRQSAYYESGNPFLLKLMGAVIHECSTGVDDQDPDEALHERAAILEKAGKRPYVIPTGEHHTPYGALGYVQCAEELLAQFEDRDLSVDAIVVASGSATSHAGLLTGLRAVGCPIPVYGFCVRREKRLQFMRLRTKCVAVAELIGSPGCIGDDDIRIDDVSFHPGYGQLNALTVEAVKLMGSREGIILDPTYTGKSLIGLMAMVRRGDLRQGHCVVYLHTGGAPGVFGYPELTDG